MSRKELSHDEYVVTKRNELVTMARKVLRGEVGIIEGFRAIVGLRKEIDADHLDDYFLAFIAVASETDGLPVGPVSDMWDSNALESQDGEIQHAESLYRESVYQACDKLIKRFGD